MKTITIKKNSKMKTIKLNKNSKARQPRKMKCDTKADQITKIKRLINDFFEAEDNDGCWDDEQYSLNAMELIDKIYLEVGGKLKK